MAERIEEPEADASPAGIAPGDGVAAGVALALGRSRPGSKLPPEAAEFLTRQSRLVDLQMEHLHEQRELVLSRLRWGRFSDRVKAALQVMTALVGLAVVLVVGGMAWRAHEDHGVRIEAFSVPPELAQKGLTGQVVASQLLDKLAGLQAKTVTGRPASSYADDWGGDIKVEIPETGVSIGELYRYLREWLGSETRISGEVVRTSAGLSVTARAGANPGETFQGPDADIDKLMQQAAEAIYRQTQPYRWAVYLASTGRQDEALKAYRQLAANGAPEDRAWAYAGWANVLAQNGQFQQAVEAAQNALAIDPDLQQARIYLAIGLTRLGRLEEALQASRRVTKDLKAGRTKGVAKGELAETIRTSEGAEALMRGDVQAAATLLTQQRFTEEGAAAQIRPIGAQALADNHDVTGARKMFASTTPGGAQILDSASPGDAQIFNAELIALDDWPALASRADAMRATPQAQNAVGSVMSAAEAAEAYAHVGRLAEAQALLAPLPLTCIDCLRARGLVAAREHDWAAVDRWYAEAARQAPSIPDPQADWGQALLDKGDLDGAIAKFEDAHRITPHFADPLELWGEALMRKGDYAGAVAKFAEADQYAPRWGRNHLRWGEALLRIGRYREARAQFEQANGMDLSVPDRAALTVFLDRTAKGPLHG
jgi:tetratricopeptide (TPR) repeat protein